MTKRLPKDDWSDFATGPEPVAETHGNKMSEAPRDGTMLRLKIRGGDHPTDDVSPNDGWWTIGFNNYLNDGNDRWQFAGWCWCHDHFTDASDHGGTVIDWLPLLEN